MPLQLYTPAMSYPAHTEPQSSARLRHPKCVGMTLRELIFVLLVLNT